jgi:hypothetical protein
MTRKPRGSKPAATSVRRLSVNAVGDSDLRAGPERHDVLALQARQSAADGLRMESARHLSQRHGNRYVQAQVEGSIPMARSLAAVLTDGATALAARQVASEAAPLRIQRQQAQEAEGGEAADGEDVGLSQEQIDAIVSESIQQTLHGYQNIPVRVEGTQPMAEGDQGPPAQVTMTTTVKAAYYINTETARNRYGPRRGASFNRVIRAMRGELSMIQGSTSRRTAGQAVQFGKATPAEASEFINEAISQGVVQRYAVRQRVLKRGQQLVELPLTDLQSVIQDWVHHVGVGVDCSGFVMTATIRAREKVRAAQAAAGVAEDQLPAELSHRERNARSYRNEPQVGSPADLRVGDAWVVRNGAHIRLVTAVRSGASGSGGAAVEFDTAESSGTSTQSTVGPTSATWRTASETTFLPVREVGGAGRRQRGSFHRVP